MSACFAWIRGKSFFFIGRFSTGLTEAMVATPGRDRGHHPRVGSHLDRRLRAACDLSCRVGRSEGARGHATSVEGRLDRGIKDSRTCLRRGLCAERARAKAQSGWSSRRLRLRAASWASPERSGPIASTVSRSQISVMCRVLPASPLRSAALSFLAPALRRQGRSFVASLRD